MAHRSAAPSRMQSRKKRLPRSRGEKYVAPDVSDEIRPTTTVYEPTRTITRRRHKRRLARKGNAHDLLDQVRPEDALRP